jgi:hypothetical protein
VSEDDGGVEAPHRCVLERVLIRRRSRRFFKLEGDRLHVTSTWRIMPNWADKGMQRSLLVTVDAAQSPDNAEPKTKRRISAHTADYEFHHKIEGRQAAPDPDMEKKFAHEAP